MKGGTDGIIKMQKKTQTHANTTSHFDTRARQRRRSSSEYSVRCLKGLRYMQRHRRSARGKYDTTFRRSVSTSLNRSDTIAHMLAPYLQNACRMLANWAAATPRGALADILAIDALYLV